MKRVLIAMLLIISFLQAGITFGTGSKVNFGNANVGVYGSLKNQGTITYLSTSKLSFVGSSLDTLTNVYTFPNLIINKPAGYLRLNNSTNNFALTGNVTFTQGNILTGTNTFELGTSATVTGETATKYISGTVKAARAVGTGANTFGGIGYDLSSGTGDLGTVTVYRYTGDGSEVSIYGTEGIWRKWTVATSNAFSGTRTVTSSWLSNEDNGNNLAALKVWKYEPVKSTDGDADISEFRKLILKKNDIAAAKSKGIEGSGNSDLREPEVEVINYEPSEEDSKTLYWVEVDGATFNTAASPRTATYTINGATSYTICSATNTFADGAGTEANPYQIENLTQLNNVRNYPTACFIQIADIDATPTADPGWNAGAGWLPIGNATTKFTGKYNGQGHTIDGLFINRATSYNGLFGYAQGSTISNLHLTNLDITSTTTYAGGLVGYNYSSASIINCSSQGDVTATSYTGGLVGYNSTSSIITDCFSNTNVTGTTFVGGIAGMNTVSSSITSSYSTGSALGSLYYIGGFIGYNNTSCQIQNCYSESNVFRASGGTYTSYIAGFAGSNYAGAIVNCYSTGSVTYIDSTNPTNRGFAGYIYNSTGYVMTGNFWNIETSGQTTTYGTGTATGLTKTQMRTLATFTNATWDFQGESVNGTSDIWGINAVLNSGYPFLSWQGITHRPSPFAGGIGTTDEPFLVSNLTHLDSVRGFLSYNFLQTADIDASPTTGWNAGAGWNPIGAVSPFFTGNYDGAHYDISGLFINRAANYQSLFGYMSGGVVSKLHLLNANITGSTYVGGIAGYMTNSAYVSDCSVKGIINATVQYVAGIAGYLLTSSVIENSFADVNVTGQNYVAGIAGRLGSASQAVNCYSLGNISRLSGYTGTYLGGISGYNNDSKILKCYSASPIVYIDTTNPTTKGIAGGITATTNYEMADNFFDSQVSGQTSTSGVGTAKTTAEMRNVATYTLIGSLGLTNPWDFEGDPNNDTGTNDYWNIHTSLNSGYPYLNWEYRLAVEAPANLALVVSGTDVIITWDPVTNAAGYLVYSSTNPYGTFMLDETGSFNGTEWTGTLTGTRNFYYVTATNDTKVVPSKTIMINNLYMNK
ncbi:MAG: hypothetical protein A2Y39_04030 [Candidatus Delongbacteria bacterium GWF2_40_14]|nr:MAG: hypothetical protein A2Y39_04030 [Candidatus Delongbacteria bacterium GWF2_40_14]